MNNVIHSQEVSDSVLFCRDTAAQVAVVDVTVVQLTIVQCIVGKMAETRQYDDWIERIGSTLLYVYTQSELSTEVFPAGKLQCST